MIIGVCVGGGECETGHWYGVRVSNNDDRSINRD